MPGALLPRESVRQGRMYVVSQHYHAKRLADVFSVVEGRLCQKITDTLSCCMPCPMTDWAYPDSFQTLSLAAGWVAVVSTVCCVFLLLSWIFLPVEKTNRHYMSICLTIGVVFMNVSAKQECLGYLAVSLETFLN